MTQQRKDFWNQAILIVASITLSSLITAFATGAKLAERVDIHTDQIKVLDEKKADKEQIIELLERNERYLIRIESKVDQHIKDDK